MFNVVKTALTRLQNSGMGKKHSLSLTSLLDVGTFAALIADVISSFSFIFAMYAS